MLNKIYTKHAHIRKNCFLSDIKSSKSPQFKTDRRKNWTMNLTLLPHQIFILSEELFNHINPDLVNHLKIYDDLELR